MKLLTVKYNDFDLYDQFVELCILINSKNQNEDDESVDVPIDEDKLMLLNFINSSLTDVLNELKVGGTTEEIRDYIQSLDNWDLIVNSIELTFGDYLTAYGDVDIYSLNYDSIFLVVFYDL